MSNSVFKGKIVLISGGAKGIGKEIALSFAKNGAKIAVFDKDPNSLLNLQKELTDLGVENITTVVDISDFKTLNKFLTQIKQKFGRIDILINNAGFGLAKKIQETSFEDFDSVISTNLKGSLFLTQMSLPMIRDGGSIIFITSIHASNPSLDPTYDGSKAAINSLVLNLALALSPRKIRVNAIAPGHIDTSGAKQPRKQKDMPLFKRAGLPKDIAEAALFLADNEKARIITGVILPVTGGLHIPIARDIKL